MEEFNEFENRLGWFIYWMQERYNIYHERFILKQPWPWTDDVILQKYKFTNTFRELDAGTIWCKERIRDPYANDKELFFNIATYRRYNWIETQEEIGYLHDYNDNTRAKVLDVIMQRYNRGDKVFTGAHMLCGNIANPDGTLPDTKVEQVFNNSFRILWEKRREIEPQPGDTLEMAFKRFLHAGIPGYGPFIVYEVISDLRWTRYLENASDIMTWANPGPGARRGVARLYGFNPPNIKEYGKSITNRFCLQVMRYLLEVATDNVKGDGMPTIEMREPEHALCEWDKYMRVLLNEGKTPKQKFTPPHLRKTTS